MRGKNKCKILRQIRQQIAEENDIPLITKECTYQGECTGTCPKCESELRYLEQQLARRQSLGKAVTVAALSVSLMAGTVGCSPGRGELQGDVPNISAPDTTGGEKSNGDGSLKLLPDGTDCDTSIDGVDSWSTLGYAPLPSEGEPDPEDLIAGRIPAPSEEQTELVELEGDVAYIPADDTETAGAPTTAPAEGEQTSEPGMLDPVGGNG